MQGNVNIPDSTITTNLSFRQLVLMNMQQLTNFPYIEKDFDALTDYELLCLVVKYLNDVIANQNEQNDSITRMYESFLALQTYVNNTKDTLEDAFNTLDNYVRTFFENLDVQDEIDHKLDEYVEDGTLEHIIASYLQTQKIYNTTVEMLADANNLVDGLNVQTLGYYTLNDGGGSFYQITDTESLTEYQEDLENGLFATLIIENDSVSVNQFGAKGDGINDDSDAINLALSSKAYNISFKKGNTYMVRGYETGQSEGGTTGLTETTGLIIPSNKNVDLNESTIKCITNERQNYNVFTIAEKENIILKNGTIIGDRATHTGATGEWGYGVSLRSSSNITLDNLKISECWGDGINLNNNGTASVLNKNITINNCICDGNRRQGISIENGDIVNIHDSQFINTGNNSLHTSPGAGCDIEPTSIQNVSNVLFDNCIFNNNYGCGLLIYGATIDKVNVINCKIINNLQQGSNASLSIRGATNVTLENNYLKANNTYFSNQSNTGENCKIINNTFIDSINAFSPVSLNNGQLFIENNKFYNTLPMPYNSVIEGIAATTENKNNTFIIKNNYFESNTENITSIIIRAGSKFEKAIIENNTFKYGARHIITGDSCIISNNNFIASSNYSIGLLTGNTNQVSILQNNTFEECSYATNNAGIISNLNNRNIIAQNNMYFKNCISAEDQITKTYTPTGFFTNTTTPSGVYLNENNSVFDNTIE